MPFRKSCAAFLALCLVLVLAFPAQAAGPAAPAVKQKIRAAFVLLETIDDQGWTTAHYDGIEYLK